MSGIGRVCLVLGIDDTLVLSSRTLIPFYVQLAKDELQLPTRTEKEWRRVWSRPFELMIAELFTLSDAEVQRVYSFLREKVANISLPPVKNGPSSIKALCNTGVPLSIVTSRKAFVKEIITGAGYGIYEFDVIVDANNTHVKPDGRAFQPIKECAFKKGMQNAWFVYIGDNTTDYEFALNAKVDFWAVCTGVMNRQDWISVGLQPNLVFPSIVEVAEQILKVFTPQEPKNMCCVSAREKVGQTKYPQIAHYIKECELINF
jgi:phosphoglycolate phosphatase-like HAD superfamily hydrolase